MSMRAKYNQDLKCFSVLFHVTWQNSAHLVQLRVASDVTFVKGLLGGHQPGHLGAARQLPVHKHLHTKQWVNTLPGIVRQA